MSDIFIDGANQFWHAGEYATPQALGGDVAEESLDHVEPGRRGWREVHIEARMLGEPFLYGGMFVRGVVVGDEMQGLVLRRLAVDLLQELQPLGVGVALLALANNLTIQYVERGE